MQDTKDRPAQGSAERVGVPGLSRRRRTVVGVAAAVVVLSGVAAAAVGGDLFERSPDVVPISAPRTGDDGAEAPVAQAPVDSPAQAPAVEQPAVEQPTAEQPVEAPAADEPAEAPDAEAPVGTVTDEGTGTPSDSGGGASGEAGGAPAAVPAGTYGVQVLGEGWDARGRYVVVDRGRLTDGPPVEPGVDGTSPVVFDTGGVAERQRVDLADSAALRFSRTGGEPSYGSGSWADLVTEVSGRDTAMLATIVVDGDGRLVSLEEPYRP